MNLDSRELVQARTLKRLAQDIVFYSQLSLIGGMLILASAAYAEVVTPGSDAIPGPFYDALHGCFLKTAALFGNTGLNDFSRQCEGDKEGLSRA